MIQRTTDYPASRTREPTLLEKHCKAFADQIEAMARRTAATTDSVKELHGDPTAIRQGRWTQHVMARAAKAIAQGPPDNWRWDKKPI